MHFVLIIVLDWNIGLFYLIGLLLRVILEVWMIALGRWLP